LASENLRFGIGLTFYNDYPGIKRLLESLEEGERLGVINGIVAIDGRYPGFRYYDSNGLSNDGSRELLFSHPNTTVMNMPNKTQVAKRNRYLLMSKPLRFDFLIIVDSDEYFVNMDWLTFKYVAEKRVRLDDFMYRIYDVRSDGDVWNVGERPRLWFRPWEVRYDVKHYRWLIKAKKHLDRPVYEGECGHALIPGCTLRHNHDLRSQERNATMESYEQWLIHEEVRQMKRKYNLP
jgi:hypothetical protein